MTDAFLKQAMDNDIRQRASFMSCPISAPHSPSSISSPVPSGYLHHGAFHGHPMQPTFFISVLQLMWVVCPCVLVHSCVHMFVNAPRLGETARTQAGGIPVFTMLGSRKKELVVQLFASAGHVDLQPPARGFPVRHQAGNEARGTSPFCMHGSACLNPGLLLCF